MKTKKNRNIYFSKIVLLLLILLFIVLIGKLIYISLSKEIEGIDLKAYAEKRNTTKKIL